MELDGKKLCMRCLRISESGGVCPCCGFDEAEYRPRLSHLPPESILNRRYLVGMALGEGGFGITYSGWDTVLNAPVAIKEYFPQQQAARDAERTFSLDAPTDDRGRAAFELGRKRFLREARMLAMFNTSPGIVSVVDCFEENGTAYIAMEFIRGKSLAEHARDRGGIRADELFQLIKPLTETLMEVHRMGLLHRDISPDNLLVGEDRRIRLIDFGAADDMPGSDGRSLSVILKYGYAPAEQYTARGEQGPWTDVYALCATMYRLLTGEAPQDALERLKSDRLAPPRMKGVKMTRRQERALLHGLSPQVKGRTESMELLRSELYNLPLPEEIKKRRRLVRLSAGVTAAAVCMSAVAAVNRTTGIPSLTGAFYRWGLRGALMSAYDGVAEEVAIPERVLGVYVVEVGDGAFRESESLKSVVVGPEVRALGDMAFYGCINLERVILPDGLLSIGALAFGNCGSLGSIEIPASVTEIAPTAFEGCREKLIVYGRAGSEAERACREMGMRFSVPEDYEYIVEDGAATITGYRGASTDICFPAEIDGYPVTAIGDPAGEESLLSEVTFTSVVVPEGVQVLYARVFADEFELESVSLPETLLGIREMAFRDCISLKEIDIPDEVRVITDSAFTGCAELERVKFPALLEWIEDDAFFGCYALREIELPDKLFRIGGYAFYGCKSLSRASFGAALRKIGERAFFSCESLEYAVFPDALETIGESAFENCVRLRDVLIPSAAENIGKWAFDHCDAGLTLFSGEDSAAERFAGDRGLAFVDVNTWATDVGYSLDHEAKAATITSYRSDAKDVVLPTFLEGYPVTDIAEEAGALYWMLTMEVFAARGQIEYTEEIDRPDETLTLPHRTERIGMNAFCGCESLRAVELPDGLKEIGDYAFGGCALEEIRIPDSVERIGYAAFQFNSLTSANIPANLRVLETAVFEWNRLTGIVVPPTVRRIAEFAVDPECVLYGEPGSEAEQFTLRGYEYDHVFKPISEFPAKTAAEPEPTAAPAPEQTTTAAPESARRQWAVKGD